MGQRRDVPVAVVLLGGLGREVTAFAETEAGWQVVGVDGPPRPELVLAAAPSADLPTVVVIDGTPTPEAVREHLAGGAVDVIGWPGDAERLLTAPLRIRGRTATPDGPPVLRVAGAAGGVGTSTVALALAGLLAWSGRRTLVVGGDDLLALCGVGAWTGPGAVEVSALEHPDAGAEVAALRRPVAGVDGLCALGGGGLVRSTAGWPADAVVVDAGQALGDDPDLVCSRPDVGLQAVAGRSRAVVVIGDGPLDRGGVRAALGYAPAGWLPASARVARAGLGGRVPSGLPGAWLRQLREVLGGIGAAR
ncbi:MAG: hypothetical protein H0V93_16955 [Euzebyales bacterium]|nr:hypothetical protein [Euzebyales bacterium]